MRRAAILAPLGLMLGLYALLRYSGPVEKLTASIPHAKDWLLLISPLTVIPAAVLIPGIALLVEWLFVGWERSSLRKLFNGNRNARRDALYTVFALLPLQIYIKAFFTLGVIYVTEIHIAPALKWNLSGYLPYWPLQYVVVIVGTAFFQYWQHRILHTVPLLWETHKLHHSATEMTVFNLNRESFFTTGVADVLIFVPLALIGSQEMNERGGSFGAIDLAFMALFAAYSMFNVANHYLIHSEWRTTYGWFGRWVFISPAAHRVHHSILPQYWNKNFSVSLTLWDRVFGTWEEAAIDEVRNTPIGYVGNIYNQGSALTDYFWLPMREFGRHLIKAWHRRPSEAPEPPVP